jgi:hypothetical protein
MGIIGGTGRVKSWTGDYSFAVDGGAALAVIPLRSNDGPIPSGSVVVGGVLQVTGGFTTGTSAEAAIHVNAANDLVSATIVSGAPYSSTGNKDIIVDSTGSTAITLTADRSPTLTISVGTITAGIARLVLFYK